MRKLGQSTLGRGLFPSFRNTSCPDLTTRWWDFVRGHRFVECNVLRKPLTTSVLATLAQ